MRKLRSKTWLSDTERAVLRTAALLQDLGLESPGEVTPEAREMLGLGEVKGELAKLVDDGLIEELVNEEGKTFRPPVDIKDGQHR